MALLTGLMPQWRPDRSGLHRAVRSNQIPTGKRRGQNPSLASIYRALAEQAKRQQYPDAIEQAHAEFAANQANA
jgi:hypothetical protein